MYQSQTHLQMQQPHIQKSATHTQGRAVAQNITHTNPNADQN